VNWALVNGERETGVTLHHIVHKADAGDIVGQLVVPIAFDDTALLLFGKLCRAAGVLLDELLPRLKEGRAPRVKQDLTAGSYYGGRRPEDGRINWSWPAERIYNLIRAVTDPYPGTFCYMPDGSRLMVWWGIPDGEGRDGGNKEFQGVIEIEDKIVRVRTGQGRIRLEDVQIADVDKLSAGERITGDGIFNFLKDREGMKLL
jgi:methionyl-tRNA formyltransferase